MEEELLPLRDDAGRQNGWAIRLRRGCCCCGGEALEEAWRLGYVAAPMVAVTMSQFLVQVFSTMIVGHLGQLDLAAASVAFSLANVTGFSLLSGMANGLETLCGQAYGAKQYSTLGTYTYRAIFTLLVVCLPITVVWVSMGKLLPLVGQDPLISQEVARYAAWMIPGLFAYAITQCLTKFLQTQSMTLPLLLSSVSTLCLHIILCYVLVYKSSLGNVGVALSLSISYWFNAFILMLYIRYSSSCKVTRPKLSREAFKDIAIFLRLALPSALMLCLEWWCYEIIILLSRLLPNPTLETSVLSIFLNTVLLLYCIPFGVSCAASTRVSNELGAGNPRGAQLVVRVSMFIAISEAALVSGALLAMRRILGYAYSNEEEVVNYVAEMVPLVSYSVITDNLQAVLSGIARGSGWQHLGAYINLGAFYLVGIPVAIVLGFLVHLGGRGMWIGIMCGTTTQAILFVLITIFANWQHQVDVARERVFHERLDLQNGLK
ncbi:protein DETOXIFICATION 12-like [Canna indica]|uniref:Protein DETOXIFICATION n=1 Tax=Canna indica TaxID=4628 RepID=A0AAQ3K1C1_9LILI|nr:protein DETOXIFICATION 12-like [Canna indica]